jgi:hypothetical protein
VRLLQDDEFKDAISAIVSTSPTRSKRRPRKTRKTTAEHEEGAAVVADSGVQCLVRWKDTWEPAANLSESCMARWNAEEQEQKRVHQRRTLKLAKSSTTASRKRARSPTNHGANALRLVIRNKRGGGKEGKAITVEPDDDGDEQRTGVKRKREHDEDDEDEDEEEENESQAENEDEDDHAEDSVAKEDEGANEDEDAEEEAKSEGLGVASPLLAHNFERHLRKRKRSRLKEKLALTAHRPDRERLAESATEANEDDHEQLALSTFDDPHAVAHAWFPPTVRTTAPVVVAAHSRDRTLTPPHAHTHTRARMQMSYHESLGMTEGSPDILSMQAVPPHTIDLLDLPHGTPLTTRQLLASTACAASLSVRACLSSPQQHATHTHTTADLSLHSLLDIFEMVPDGGVEAEESANNLSTNSSGSAAAGVDDVSSFLSLSPLEEEKEASSIHQHPVAPKAGTGSPYVSYVASLLPHAPRPPSDTASRPSLTRSTLRQTARQRRTKDHTGVGAL